MQGMKGLQKLIEVMDILRWTAKRALYYYQKRRWNTKQLRWKTWMTTRIEWL